jgi:molybdate transport system ATP-binding protein
MIASRKEHLSILIASGISFDYKKILDKELLSDISFYSEAAIKSMIEEESKRDTSDILDREGQSLRAMSTGERKVAVFKFLVSRKPKTLIIDNFYENLDPKNQVVLEGLLHEILHEIKIIQVVRKEKELFPFIYDYFTLFDKELVPYRHHISSYFNSYKKGFSAFKIPRTTTRHTDAYDAFVNLSDVTVKFYEKTVLSHIHWKIKQGEFWQLIGANGSGKTTLLSLITGDSHKAYGQDIVLFDKLKGTEENVWEIKQKIGYFTPNITELFDRRHSVLHMVLSGFYDSIGLYVKPLSSHVKIAYEWLLLLGLERKANVTFTTLCLPEQRLVMIARAMVKHPPLLILDEPAYGLDQNSLQLLVSLINKFFLETSSTIIYVSHSLEKGMVSGKTFKLSKTVEGSTGEIIP